MRRYVGIGRKRINEEDKKVQLNLALPKWLVDRIKKNKPYMKRIEEILKKEFGKK